MAKETSGITRWTSLQEAASRVESILPVSVSSIALCVPSAVARKKGRPSVRGEPDILIAKREPGGFGGYDDVPSQRQGKPRPRRHAVDG